MLTAGVVAHIGRYATRNKNAAQTTSDDDDEQREPQAETSKAQQDASHDSSTTCATPIDPEEPSWWSSDKLITPDTDIKIRHGFVRKVYGLLSVMHMISFGVAIMFYLWEPAGKWIVANFWLAIVSICLVFITLPVVAFAIRVAGCFPVNIIMLVLYGVSFGVILGLFCARFSTFAFALAPGIWAAVTVALTIFAIQTKWDFTGWAVLVLVPLVGLTIMGIVLCVTRDKIVWILYCSIGALPFSFYLVCNTQRLFRGKHHKVQYPIDDSVFAALTLILDTNSLLERIDYLHSL